MLLCAHLLRVIEGGNLAVLICRLDALHAASHRLKQGIFEFLAHHVDLIATKVLAIGRLHVALGECLSHRRQVSFVVVNAR